MSNEQTSTCTEAAPRNVQPRLSGRDREIAIQAIAAHATGTPVEAAYQILAGIEALDAGPDAPMVVLWPTKIFGTTEERAGWHVAEKDRLLGLAASFDRAREHARRMKEASCSGVDSENPPCAEVLADGPSQNSGAGYLEPTPGRPPMDFISDERIARVPSSNPCLQPSVEPASTLRPSSPCLPVPLEGASSTQQTSDPSPAPDANDAC